MRRSHRLTDPAFVEATPRRSSMRSRPGDSGRVLRRWPDMAFEEIEPGNVEQHHVSLNRNRTSGPLLGTPAKPRRTIHCECAVIRSQKCNVKTWFRLNECRAPQTPRRSMLLSGNCLLILS